MATKKTKTKKKTTKRTSKAKGSTARKGKTPITKTKNDQPLKAHLQEIVSLEARISDVKGKIDDCKEQAKTHKSRLAELERERHSLITNDTPPLFHEVETKRKGVMQTVIDHSAGRGGKGKAENVHKRTIGSCAIGEAVKSKSGNKGKVVAHTTTTTLVKTPGVREPIVISHKSDEWYPVK